MIASGYSTVASPSLMFAAVADQEPLDEVHIITTRGEYAKRVEERAVHNLMAAGKRITQSSVARETENIIHTSVVAVQEAVYVNDQGIFVVVRAMAVDDDAVIRSMDLVGRALDQLDGKHGKVVFGEPLTFTKTDMPWLTVH